MDDKARSISAFLLAAFSGIIFWIISFFHEFPGMVTEITGTFVGVLAGISLERIIRIESDKSKAKRIEVGLLGELKLVGLELTVDSPSRVCTPV